MGKSRKRRNGQLKKQAEARLLPFSISASAFIDAIITENIVDLRDVRVKKREFLNNLLQKYFKTSLSGKNSSYIHNLLSFTNFLNYDSTKELFSQRLRVLETPITPTKEQLNTDKTSTPITNTPVTPLRNFNQSIDNLIVSMSPIAIGDNVVQNSFLKPSHVRKLMVDSCTSPFKFEQICDDNSVKPSLKSKLMTHACTSPFKFEKENDDIRNLMTYLSPEHITIIGSIVKSFISQGLKPSDQNIKISENIEIEAFETQSIVIFENDESEANTYEKVTDENVCEKVHETETLNLKIWKKTETNNFYCLQTANTVDKFWVKKELQFTFCLKILDVVYNVDTARNILNAECLKRKITCCFSFEKAALNATAMTFSANGHCFHKKDGCQVKFRVHTTKGNNEERHFLLFLNSNEPVDHSNMKVRFQQIRGKARDEMKANFSSPELELQKLCNIDYSLAEKGNTQGLVRQNTLQQISSESNRSNSMIKCELYKLITCIQCGETGSFGTLIVNHDSIQLLMIDDSNYELLQKFPEKSVTIHTDASGQMVKPLNCCHFPSLKLHGKTKAFLVHAIAMQFEGETLVVASMVSNDQTGTTLGLFHSYFMTQLMLRLNKCLFKRIVTDWCFANFIAITRAYNNMTVIDYLNFMYELVINKKYVEFSPTFIYLIICYSHFMKLISRFAQREISKSVENGFSKKQKGLLMSFFAVIRGSKTIEEVEGFFKTMCVIFCNEYLTKEVQDALLNCKEMNTDKMIENEENDEDAIYIEERIQEQLDDNRTNGGTLREKSKWYRRFKIIYDDKIAIIETDINKEDKKLNPYYVPGMINRAVELYFCYLPIWSRLGHALEDNEEDMTFTNGLIESLFKKLKHNTKGPLRKRPTEFLRSMRFVSRFDRTKIQNFKFFPKTSRKAKKFTVQNTENRGIKREFEDDVDDKMDPSQHKENWQKPGKTPKGFKYSISTFPSSIPNTVVQMKPEETIESQDSDYALISNVSIVSIEDERYLEEERKETLAAAKLTKLTFYEGSQIVSTLNYYKNWTKMARVADYALYEYLTYNDMISLTDISAQLTDVAMYCAFDLFIKAHNFTEKFVVYTTIILTSLFNGYLCKIEEVEEMKKMKQWVDMFTNPDMIYICPFLVSRTAQINHWVIAIVDLKKKRFDFYDSLKTYDGKIFYSNFIKFIESKKINGKNWTFTNHTVTHQNGVTCGKHVLGYGRKYMLNVDNLEVTKFTHISPCEEAEIFKEIIYEHADTGKNICLRCNEDLIGGTVRYHLCLMCGHGIHVRPTCLSNDDLVEPSTSTEENIDYVCYNCVSYVKREVLKYPYI